MSFTHANIVSILVAAVAAWIFGGIYYTSLGKWWMAAQGKTLEQCKAEQASKSAVALAAREAAVGLGIIIAFFRNSSSVDVDDASLMKN